MAQKYIHGFEKKEQDRLIYQADFLEPYIYQGVDLEFTKNLLEVGCGVGAQTQILCRRFPKLQIDGIDLSEAQLKTASKYLSKEIKSGRVSLQQQDAQKMKLSKTDYDAAFICWFLEHVPDPLLVLKNVYKNLKPGGKVYISEVFNHSLFMEPYSPAYLKYWFEFNDFQWEIKGHPFVGAQLGNLLKASGFKNINVEVRPFHFDAREPEKRAAFIDFFFDILLSAEQTLIEKKRVSPQLIKQMKAEVEIVKKSKNSVFFYSYVRATATK
ncbi:MAG: class I SAM-dependent methyltransferase [Bdellovibrionota bacterium]